MEVNARVNWIKFYNEENFYAVLSCSDDDEKFDVIATVPNPVRGALYDFNGEWAVHPKFGRQFQAETCNLAKPDSIKDIEKLLASGAIRGIGKVTAKRIVEAFGKDSLKVIENDPERLKEVRGIGKKNLEKIKIGWTESQSVVEIQKFLQGCGVSMGLAPKIYKEYGSGSVETIKENPYILTEDLWGVGFHTADRIAKECGISSTDSNRISACVCYYLKHNSLEGHCFEYGHKLMVRVSEILKIPEMEVRKHVRHMLDHKEKIVQDDDVVYLKTYFYAEQGIGRKLYEINQYVGNKVFVDIPKLEEEFGIKYDEAQAQAIRGAVQNKISVITGGPGTGKTTIIKAIVKAFEEKTVLLASPTGRAAKRMSEVTGMEAKTIHRLLEYNPNEKFARNEDSPLEGDVLILDECSMIDVLLMYNLLKAVPEHMNLVMVGDVDQLPSVGPGNVLADVINSGCFFVAKLERIFRQAEESDIVTNAHRINRGESLKLRGRDVVYIETSKPWEVIKELAKKEDIQVITPMKKTLSGTLELNNAIQDAINPGENVFERKYVRFRIGDRVMQIRNNYDKGVFNGSFGIVESYADDILTVDFDGMRVQYENSDIDELMLSYAITIHKSQGSEFPVVVVPLSLEHKVMLQRNLLYTAFTRPSKKLYLVGDMRAADLAIGNEIAMKRNTRLIERLRGWCYGS